MSLREKAKNAIKKAMSLPGKALDKFEGRLKSVDESNRARNTKMIEKNWGNTENYMKLQEKDKQVKAIKSSLQK